MAIPTPYIHLPMRPEQDDVDDTRTLDVIGTNNADLFSDPEKLRYKGYSIKSDADYLKIDDPLPDAANITFSCLVKHPDITADADICGAYDGSNTFFLLMLDEGTDLQFFVGSAAATAKAEIADITPGAIMHIVGVYDGTDTILYVDGQQVDTATTAVAPDFQNQDIFIGRRYSDANYWHGKIYDVKFWDSALTEYEISELYASDMDEYYQLLSYPEPVIHLPMRIEDYEYDYATPEVVNDWDMSDADGDPVSAWTALNSATLTKVSNGEGGQALRIAYNGTATPGVQQLTLGQNRNKIYVRLRGDGSTEAILRVNSVELFRTTTANTWQEIEINHYSAGTDIRVDANTSSPGAYVEADIISAKTFSSRTLDIAGTYHGVIDGSEDVATKALPIPDKGFGNFSINRGITIPSPPLTGVSEHTFSLLVRNSTAVSTEYLMDIWNGVGGVFALFLKLSSGTFRYYCGGASSVNAANIAHDVATNELLHIVGQYDGTDTKIFMNGIEGVKAATPLSPTYNNDDIFLAKNASGTQNWASDILGFHFWDSALSEDEIKQLYYDSMLEYAAYKI